MIRRLRAAFAAALVAAPLLLYLHGRLALPSRSGAERTPPAELIAAFSEAVADLGARSSDFQSQREVVRSLEGGGIAVNRLALFNAAGQALAGAPAGTGLALTDPAGAVHAWWGDPPSLEGLQFSAGGLAVRWSAARLVVVTRKPVGEGGFSGLVYASRSFPVDAPAFARALGLSGRSAPWEPTAQGGPALLTDAAGAVVVGARRGSVLPSTSSARDVALALLLAVAALCAGRVRDPLRVGLALAIAFLATEARFGELFPLDPGAVAALALGWAALPFAFAPLTGRPFGTGGGGAVAGRALVVLAIFSAGRLETPDLGARVNEALLALPRVAGLAALFFSGLSLAAVRREGAGRGRAWTTAAVLFSAAAITVSLAAVSASPLYRVAVFAAAAFGFELWSRAVGEARGREGFGEPRLVLGATLLVVLAAAPLSEQDRAREAYRVAHTPSGCPTRSESPRAPFSPLTGRWSGCRDSTSLGSCRRPSSGPTSPTSPTASGARARKAVPSRLS